MQDSGSSDQAQGEILPTPPRPAKIDRGLKDDLSAISEIIEGEARLLRMNDQSDSTDGQFCVEHIAQKLDDLERYIKRVSAGDTVLTIGTHQSWYDDEEEVSEMHRRIGAAFHFDLAQYDVVDQCSACDTRFEYGSVEEDLCPDCDAEGFMCTGIVVEGEFVSFP